MSIRVALNHKTRHRYANPVWLSPHVVRLRPAPHCRTPIVSYSITVTPADHFINWQQDPYSNYLARLVFPHKTTEFCVEIDLVAEMTVINPFDFFMEKYAEEYPFSYDALLERELKPYLETEAPGPKMAELIAKTKRTGLRSTDYLVELNQVVQGLVKYLIRLEPGIQSCEDTLTKLSGSCRDSAWLVVQLLRQQGLAARFVSGYLIQLKPDITSLDGPSGASSDFTDLHAWAEVYLPGAGWVGIDPTSGLLAGEGHIPLACTADPVTAAAITGYFNPDDKSITEKDPGEELGKEYDPAPASPSEDDFSFSMSVTRVHETPRVTKPYSPEQWSQIEALGHQVDSELQRGDVRMTMGGEPTFVSIDDVDAPEWTSDALGPKKYRQADKLVRRLRDRFGPGGFIHHGQGKWYPGESLPRWAFGLYWRKDGQPIWRNTALLADEFNITRRATDLDAQIFATNLAGRLGVDPKFVQAGFEDVWYYLWKEQRLPVNVDPFDSKLAKKEDRDRLARIFQQGLEKVIGYCMPLRRRYHRDGTAAWISGPWFFRPERMYLVPGDSPMGYRLPLESIPWVAPEEYPHYYERDPWEAHGPLPSKRGANQLAVEGGPEPRMPIGFREQVLDDADGSQPELETSVATAVAELDLQGRRGQLPGGRGGASGDGDNGSDSGDHREADGIPGRDLASARRSGHDDSAYDAARSHRYDRPQMGQSASQTVRTALCTEVRGGVLRIFMPPVRYLEDYLELIEAIEDTAAELNLPVLVEGYTPPYDWRVTLIKVTPDPGVIEVNLQPAGSWDELVTNTTALYEEARQCRLTTEKFMVDGRHIGTGGGNHIVIGGPTPADSPLLRRPDLLRSMLGYWLNHPSLSYLFSGLFVGPTCQAPRVDEARSDQVYELELAFREIPGYAQLSNIPPWLVDRIFRNLLIDVTGNTHRAEFCIDKLYAPESPTGRLGLLEMRGFEMPPHSQMSLTQHLLLRALMAMFWNKPYTKPLVRWRTEIHDRFLLPYFAAEDLGDVLDDLKEAGFPFREDWFAAHMEFRFPQYGTIAHRGVVMELRQAIEPWNVLGEVPGIGSTVRYVDSSLERLQVLVRGMVDSRHRILCNSVAVPLHPTGTNGEFVAGVRYRAWQPPTCLHPTIGVHAPLIFDIFDTWSNRSIGGCKYHVSHPGGRSYQTFPVNAYEAESRRAARFFKFGHTPGRINVIEPPGTAEFPFTLDMRRV